MYVETDFLLALAKTDDWLREQAIAALEEYDTLHTSLASYAELLVFAYDRAAGTYTIDVPRAVADLVTQVPITPDEHEEAVLTAAVLADEHGLTPFDAIHAGIAVATGEPILSSEQAYGELELERVPLEPSNTCN
jgi:predicted nucleic acid-binding protein